MEQIKETRAKKVFEFFKAMNEIPRGSGNEKAVSDWLVAFAKERDLEVIQDEALNVIIKKPGTEGRENLEPVILQGHMDMVAEKATESDHDFSKDPIAFIVDGDFLRADQTTLGADNGIAVAMSLAILDSDDIPHPPVEVMITTSEETGMDGAAAIDPKHFNAKRLINIDSEEEGKLLVSCAGGRGVTLVLAKALDGLAEDAQVVEITISGLKGGHSGMEIDQQRANANKLMGRLLRGIAKEMDLRLISLNGGTKHNAIPREARALVAVPDQDRAGLDDLVKTWQETFLGELKGIDEGLVIEVAEGEKASETLDEMTTRRAIQLLNLIPHGVQSVSKAIEGLVQTSNNLGVVTTTDDTVRFQNAIRSSLGSEKAAMVDLFLDLAELTGAEAELADGYPEWQFNPESELREVFIQSYEELYDKKPEVTAIHAGLECGLLGEKFNGKVDMISFGPDMFDVHTPQEHLSISSTERTFEYLIKVLSKLK